MNSTNPNLAVRVTPENEYYIFTLSENVVRTHIYYKNRYGIEIAGDLYTAKNMDPCAKYPALIVGPPFGGVKEQGPGVYANELAQRGFVVLTFDPAFHGFSGGERRGSSSVEMYAEDFSAGVDFLGTKVNCVNREKIGVIGICGSGGFALAAAAMDSRIKAIATSVMYDIAGLASRATGDERNQQLKTLSEQRWKDAEKDQAYIPQNYPDTPADSVPEGQDLVSAEFFSFYGMKRGWTPNSCANVSLASNLSLMNFPALTHIADISPRPILFVTGENAHSKAFSETAYANAAEPKELYVVSDANHVDLYDDIAKIPFDKFEDFFKSNLK